MLAGVKFSKKEKKEKKGKEKKEKKKHKHDGSKIKKKKKKQNWSTDESSASDDDSRSVDGRARSPSVEASEPAKAEDHTGFGGLDDFLGAMTGPARGNREDRLRAEKLAKQGDRPDPEKLQVHSMELNKHLGANTEADLPAGAIPAHLCVGDGGSLWRRRALKRARETAQEERRDVQEVLAETHGEDFQVNRSDWSSRRGGGDRPDWRSRGKPDWRSRREEGDKPREDGDRPDWRSRRNDGESDRHREDGNRPDWRSRRNDGESDRHREDGNRPDWRSRGKSDWRSRRDGSRERPRSPPRKPRYRTPSGSRSPRAKSPARGSPPRRETASGSSWRRESRNDTAELDELTEKYGMGPKKVEEVAPSLTNEQADQMDANEISGLAMQAMLEGNMDEYNRLNNLLVTKQMKGSHKAVSHVLEEVDGAGRNVAMRSEVHQTSVALKGKLRGQGRTVVNEEEGYYNDDDVDLATLVRRERVEGVQDYTKNYAQSIINKGKRFQMIGEDEDEAHALGLYENKAKKMDDKKHAERERKAQVRDSRQLAKNLSKCGKCPESEHFRHMADLIIARSSNAYVAFQQMKFSTVQREVHIYPCQHSHAVTHLEQESYDEMRNYQKCLVRFYESRGEAVVFMETVRYQCSQEKALLNAGPHTSIEALPIPKDLVETARTYFHKAINEVGCDWAQHKKLITTTPAGARRHIPKGFTYFHVDFGLQGGFATIIESNDEFPKNFGRDIVCGLLEMDRLMRPYKDNKEFFAIVRETKDAFKEFDWASSG